MIWLIFNIFFQIFNYFTTWGSFILPLSFSITFEFSVFIFQFLLPRLRTLLRSCWFFDHFKFLKKINNLCHSHTHRLSWISEFMNNHISENFVCFELVFQLFNFFLSYYTCFTTTLHFNLFFLFLNICLFEKTIDGRYFILKGQRSFLDVFDSDMFDLLL